MLGGAVFSVASTSARLIRCITHSGHNRGPPHAMLFADDLVLCENTHTKKQKNSLNYGEIQLRTRDYESAGTRRNTSHRLPVMTKLNLVEKKSRM